MKIFLVVCTAIVLGVSTAGKAQDQRIKDYSSYILTPSPPPSPRINGPKVYGVRPGNPVIYRIPCTGDRPMRFTTNPLPDGLFLDSGNGILKGAIEEKGTYPIQICAVNSEGKDSIIFKIIVGDKLARTPPMGWNSWYIHYDRISDRLMRQAADQMISSGMADYGYQYVNIDDCWMVKVDSDDPEIGGPVRTEDGTLLTNKRFPDMKAMTDYIHSKGLKAGNYISPGPRTCAGYAGSYGFEKKDAETFAAWGFDFLKYDWCSYREKAGGDTQSHLMEPYKKMWDILRTLDRDIVFNLCQYGMGAVWEWGGKVGNSWRTTGDLGLEERTDLPGFYSIGMRNAEHWPFARPGEWNDPDYILIGWVGDAHNMGEGKPTDLTPYEQYAYMSMWSLMAAPLIFSGDMSKLDPFTLNVLCNHEIIDVNQDPLGKQARIIRRSERDFVLVKELEDGSVSLGMFNLDDQDARLSVGWAEIGVSGPQRIRDLWRQQDLGSYNETFESVIPSHGVMMVRLWPQ
jgi:alpha-galactosidase